VPAMASQNGCLERAAEAFTEESRYPRLPGKRQSATMAARGKLAVAHLTPHTPDPGPEPPAEGRLDSWKEIASYLRRDVRTVQRWEKTEGLPVRRHLHDSLGSVYAYRHELDAWREGRQPALSASEAANGRVRRRLHWAAVGGLVVLASAGLIATRPLWNGQGAAPVVLRTVQLTTDRLLKLPQLATDGSRLYFTEQVGEGWVVAAIPTSGGEPEIVPIPLTKPVVEDVSPDGSEMLVTDWSATVMVESVFLHSPLYRVPIGGGAPRRVGEVMAGGATWLPDGQTILYGDGFQLKTVDRDGTAPRTLVTLPGIPASVSVSPDGRLVRFSAVDQQYLTWSLWEVAIGGGVPHRLWPGWSDKRTYFQGAWSADGDYFLSAAHGQTPEVWVVHGGQRWFGREAAPERVTVLPVPSYCPVPSRDGQRLFLLADFCSAELVQWDPGTREFVTHPSGIAGSMVDYSPDGTWIVYVAFPANTLWRARADGTERRPLTDAPLEVGLPRWSPDGERIAFMGRTPGQLWRIYAVPSNGGSPQPLLDGQATESDPGWSPDGRSLVFGRLPENQPRTPLSIRVLDLATGHTTELPGSEGKYSPRWSPDGRHIAALPADSQKLLIFDLETGQWSEPVTGQVGFPTWSRDGTHLYYQTRDDVIHRLRLRDGRAERVVSRKGVPVAPVFPGAWFGLDPEGRLLILRDTTVTEVFAFDYAYR
jgi:Tol biopolymer transport system component